MVAVGGRVLIVLLLLSWGAWLAGAVEVLVSVLLLCAVAMDGCRGWCRAGLDGCILVVFGEGSLC